MATYVVGDVQGCARSFEALLARLGLGADDALYLAGDVVNRGSGSLESLRLARAHARGAVLGNHDLHLLACAAEVRDPKGKDTLAPVLAAPDRDALLDWLRAQPFLRALPTEDAEHLLVHAGLLPEWTPTRALALAGAAEAALRADEAGFLRAAFRKRGRAGPVWAAHVMTTLRCLDAEGAPLGGYKGPPRGRPRGSDPWFEAPGRAWSGGPHVVFGHWAALGLHQGAEVTGLDTGCVWGGRLSALCLETKEITSVPADPRDLPDR